MKPTRQSLSLLLALAAAVAWAEAATGEITHRPLLDTPVYLQISPNGRDDLEALFDALEASVAADEPQAQPVIIVLHGPEALPFIRQNYREHQAIVDRAAKLQAFRRIELRMCETWMRRNGFDERDLPPFVTTVPLAPAEIERLERDGYVRFGATLTESTLM